MAYGVVRTEPPYGPQVPSVNHCNDASVAELMPISCSALGSLGSDPPMSSADDTVSNWEDFCASGGAAWNRGDADYDNHMIGNQMPCSFVDHVIVGTSTAQTCVPNSDYPKFPANSVVPSTSELDLDPDTGNPGSGGGMDEYVGIGLDGTLLSPGFHPTYAADPIAKPTTAQLQGCDGTSDGDPWGFQTEVDCPYLHDGAPAATCPGGCVAADFPAVPGAGEFDHMDACLNVALSDNGDRCSDAATTCSTWTRRVLSPCVDSATFQDGELLAINSDPNDRAGLFDKAAGRYRDMLPDGRAVFVGIAKDGHMIAPPFLEASADGSAEQVSTGFDACNGAYFDEDHDGVAETYAYLATSTFPYTTGCFGPSDFPPATKLPTCTANGLVAAYTPFYGCHSNSGMQYERYSESRAFWSDQCDLPVGGVTSLYSCPLQCVDRSLRFQDSCPATPAHSLTGPFAGDDLGDRCRATALVTSLHSIIACRALVEVCTGNPDCAWQLEMYYATDAAVSDSRAQAAIQCGVQVATFDPATASSRDLRDQATRCVESTYKDAQGRYCSGTAEDGVTDCTHASRQSAASCVEIPGCIWSTVGSDPQCHDWASCERWDTKCANATQAAAGQTASVYSLASDGYYDDSFSCSVQCAAAVLPFHDQCRSTSSGVPDQLRWKCMATGAIAMLRAECAEPMSNCDVECMARLELLYSIFWEASEQCNSLDAASCDATTFGPEVPFEQPLPDGTIGEKIGRCFWDGAECRFDGTTTEIGTRSEFRSFLQTYTKSTGNNFKAFPALYDDGTSPNIDVESCLASESITNADFADGTSHPGSSIALLQNAIDRCPQIQPDKTSGQWSGYIPAQYQHFRYGFAEANAYTLGDCQKVFDSTCEDINVATVCGIDFTDGVVEAASPGFVCSVECARLVLPWAASCSFGPDTVLYPGLGSDATILRTATEEMAELFYSCAATASDIVNQHHCMNEYTICQLDRACTEQVDDYYRDPIDGMFRASSAPPDSATGSDGGREYVDRRCFPHRNLLANEACTGDSDCCPTPPQPENLAAQNLLSCASNSGWPSLGDMTTAVTLSPPPPLPHPDCDEDLTYPLDCARQRPNGDWKPPVCFAANASCGFELGDTSADQRRFGYEIDHRQFRCGTQCMLDFGAWDLGCDTDVYMPPIADATAATCTGTADGTGAACALNVDGSACAASDGDCVYTPGTDASQGRGTGFHAREGALALSNECYATAFLQQLGVLNGIGDGICREQAAACLGPGIPDSAGAALGLSNDGLKAAACTAEVEHILVAAGTSCTQTVTPEEAMAHGPYRDDCSLSHFGPGPNGYGEIAVSSREAVDLLSCINVNNLWNNTDDTEYVGVGQQSASVGKELLGSREILQNAIDCAEAVAAPGNDCGLSYNCTSWLAMCGVADLNASNIPDQWRCSDLCAATFLPWYNSCEGVVRDGIDPTVGSLFGIDEMAYKCKAVAMRAWHATIDECVAPLASCAISETMNPSAWWNPLLPSPTPPPIPQRCQGQILEYWAEEFYFQHTLPACERADSGNGAACALNIDGTACAVPGDECVYTEGTERTGDEWAYWPNGGTGGYCKSDDDCNGREAGRNFGFANWWGGADTVTYPALLCILPRWRCCTHSCQR